MSDDPKNLREIKEAARRIAAFIVENDGVEGEGYQEFTVYPVDEHSSASDICYNIQVPSNLVPRAELTPEIAERFVNRIYVPRPLDQAGIAAIEKRMAELAKHRKYPDGSFFTTPWSSYLIHGGTVGKI